MIRQIYKKMQNIFLITLLLVFVSVTQCYKILMVFPIPMRSHYTLGNALGKGLANAGHDVTMLAAFEDKNATKNYRNVILTGLQEQTENKSVEVFDWEQMHPWNFIFSMNFNGNQIVEGVFEHPNFKMLLKEHFEVIILEQIKNDAMKVLQCHFQAPLIMFSSLGATPSANHDFGNPPLPSYVPDFLLSYSYKMNLRQRTFNSLTYLFQLLNDNLIFLPAQRKIMEKYFPECAKHDLAMNNMSLILLNSHESSNEPIPLVPNMIQIGGFHISPPNALPKELKEFIDGAKEGVIYFSLGSFVQPSLIQPKIKDALIKVLGKLKQKILWKYDNDTLPGKPDNIKLGKWFPQSDILARPNVKLFITHGGLLSTLETVSRGVPVLSLPVFADQKMNAARAEASGFGLRVLFSDITEEILSAALNELLNNPKYRKNAQLRSTFAQDRPIKPMDLAIYWTEFIAKHKGAPHLMVAGVNLAWYQYLLLDVILLIGAVIGITLTIIFVICKKLCCSRKSKKKKE